MADVALNVSKYFLCSCIVTFNTFLFATTIPTKICMLFKHHLHFKLNSCHVIRESTEYIIIFSWLNIT